MNPRRRLLLHRLAIAATASAAFGSTTAGPATEADASRHDPIPSGTPQEIPVALTEVAPGVYVVTGASGDANVGNLGRIGNAGFIVGPSGVVAIDTGTSFHHGQALLRAIHGVTEQPVRAVVVTHARQEFLFGAAAYQAQHIPVLMQQGAAGLMRSRCEHCLENLHELLGDAAMVGSRVIKPDREFENTQTLGLAGRPVELLYFGHSSGPGATAVLDRDTGVLFAGSLVEHRRVPDVQDADLNGWQQALMQLQAMKLNRLVPGHGKDAPIEAIQDTARYLTALRSRIIELLHEGIALSEVPDAAALSEFAQWDQYDPVHRRNASVLFVRYERDFLFSTSPVEAPAAPR